MLIVDSSSIFVNVHVHVIVDGRVILTIVEGVEVSVDEIIFVASFRGGSVQSGGGEHRLSLLEWISVREGGRRASNSHTGISNGGDRVHGRRVHCLESRLMEFDALGL